MGEKQIKIRKYYFMHAIRLTLTILTTGAGETAWWLEHWLLLQPRFEFQHPRGNSQPSVTLVLQEPISSLNFRGTRHAHGAQKYMWAKHPHTENKSKEKKAIMRDQRHRTANTFLTEKSEMEDWHSPCSRFTMKNNSEVGGALRKVDQ